MKTIGILGKKMCMTQLPVASGKLQPVTLVWVGGNTVSQVKNEAKEGYNSCQIAFGKYLREIRDMSGLEVGSAVDFSAFGEGDKIKITGTSKGKGTAGVIKKYGFSRGRMTHGGGYPHRLIGSMGGGRGTNQGIPKGKKMPGRMGNNKVTQPSIIEKIDAERQIIFLRGAVPGPNKGLIILRKNG
jgi:large subunit ribosomal protein L3